MRIYLSGTYHSSALPYNTLINRSTSEQEDTFTFSPDTIRIRSESGCLSQYSNIGLSIRANMSSGKMSQQLNTIAQYSMLCLCNKEGEGINTIYDYEES